MCIIQQGKSVVRELLPKLVYEFYAKVKKCAYDTSKPLQFISSEFPIMQCQWASYLLAFHIFENTTYTGIDLVTGYVSDWEGDEISVSV